MIFKRSDVSFSAVIIPSGMKADRRYSFSLFLSFVFIFIFIFIYSLVFYHLFILLMPAKFADLLFFVYLMIFYGSLDAVYDPG